MIQSIARAVQILNLFRDTPRLGISQIAQKVGLPKTTVFGLVQSLCEENFLARDPQTHDYSLASLCSNWAPFAKADSICEKLPPRLCSLFTKK